MHVLHVPIKEEAMHSVHLRIAVTRLLLRGLTALACLLVLAAPSPADPPPCAAASFGSISVSNGSVHVTYVGVDGEQYVVQVSSNLLLAGWQSVATNTGAGGLFSYLDPTAADADSLFYRAVFHSDPTDTSGPVWLGGGTLSEDGFSPGTLSLSWSGAVDDRDIVCYGIYDGDMLLARVDGTSSNVNLTGLHPGRQYVLRIEACDVGGNCTTSGPAVVAHTSLQPEPPRNPSLGIDPNDNPGSLLLHSGECRLQRTDMSIRGRRMGFAFVRTYRSAKEENGPLGYGWDANVYMRLEELPNGDVWCHPGDGRKDLYLRQPNGSYESPLGFYTRLMTNDTGFVLRSRYGNEWQFDIQGRLTRGEDRIGSHHLYEYTHPNGQLSRIVEEFGREILFTYDGLDRLTTITDFTGREVVFTYDGDDNLVAARSPVVTGTPHGNDFPAGKTESYGYDTANPDPRLAHNLVACIAPNEVADGSLTPLDQYVYGQSGDEYDRVLFRTAGGTNATGVGAGGTLTYVYDLNPAGGPVGTTSGTTVTDRNGNVCDYFHDAEGHCVQAVDDPGSGNYTHTMSYNSHGERAEYILPEGNRVVYEFDDTNPDRFQQGNLLSSTRLPDAVRGAAQSQLRTSYTYEPLYNRLLTTTDPRGNDPTYVPQNGGTWSAARYTRTHTYDYQEAATAPPEAAEWGIAIPPSLLSSGDVNDDGRVDQAMGNRILSDGPTVNLLPGSKQAAAEGDAAQEIVTRWTYDDFGQLTQVEDPRGNIDTFDYHPENDPDGDGFDLIAGRDPTTGGYRSGQVTDALVGPRRQDPYAPAAISNAYACDRRGNVIAMTDGRGNEWLRTYNALDQLVQTENPKVDAGQAHGYLSQTFFDANDNVVTTAVENVTTSTNHVPVAGAPAFFYHSRRYDILDNLIERTDDATRDPIIPASPQPEELVTRYEYDANQNLVRTRSPLAVAGTDPHNVVRRDYDALDRLLAVTHGGGAANAATWAYAYDDNENRIAWTDAEDNDAVPGNETEHTAYDGYDRVKTATDRAGNETTFFYDPEDRIIREEFRGPVDGLGGGPVLLRSAERLYDEQGRLIQHDQDLFIATGAVTTLPTSLADGSLTPSDGKVSERYEYDAAGRQTFRVEDDEGCYAQEYDGADRLISSVIPLVDTNSAPGTTFTNETLYAYDGNDNVVERTEIHVSPEGLGPPATLVTFHVYDAVNRPVRETDPMGHTRYMEYDSRNNLVSSYDERGAPMPDPLGLYTNGFINGFGNPVRHAYDGMSRPWFKQIELHVNGMGQAPIDTSNPNIPLGLIDLVKEFDANSRTAEERDGNGQAVTYTYDALNRKIHQDNADGGFRTWSYDKDHNVIDLLDENGTVHVYTYDGLDRLISRDVLPAAKTIPGTTLPMLRGTTLQAFEYDGLSRLTRSFDNNEPADAGDDWTVTYVYDSLSRPVEEIQNGRATGNSFLSDDRSELHYPGAGRVVHFEHDPHDQIIRLSNQSQVEVWTAYMGNCCPPVSTLYTTFAPVTQQVMEVTQMLDPDKLVQSSMIVTPNGTNGMQALFRGPHHQIEQQSIRQETTPGSFIDQQFNWQLTSLNQIAAHNRQLSNTELGTVTTTLQVVYGAAQEMLEVQDLLGSTMTNQFNSTYERTNQNQSVIVFNDGGSGTGIRTVDTNWFYQFDGLNRLRAVLDPSSNVVAEYWYDADPSIMEGRRVAKQVTNSPPFDGVTLYYYDGDHVIEETTIDTNMSEQVVRQYLYNYRYPDDVLAMDVDTDADGDPDRLFFYAKDANNNVTHLFDDQGNPAEYYAYDHLSKPAVFDPATMNPWPFSPSGNPYLFTGRRYEPETGLYYYRARYFGPAAGEFLTRDPIGFWGDPGNHGNPMAYVGNNPWNQGYPSGLFLGYMEAVHALTDFNLTLREVCAKLLYFYNPVAAELELMRIAFWRAKLGLVRPEPKYSMVVPECWAESKPPQRIGSVDPITNPRYFPKRSYTPLHGLPKSVDDSELSKWLQPVAGKPHVPANLSSPETFTPFVLSPPDPADPGVSLGGVVTYPFVATGKPGAYEEQLNWPSPGTFKPFVLDVRNLGPADLQGRSPPPDFK